MKYTRRSVSDQDIRRYEMFSQVCVIALLVVQTTVTDIGSQNFFRNYNNLVASEITSSSPTVTPSLVVLLPYNKR